MATRPIACVGRALSGSHGMPPAIGYQSEAAFKRVFKRHYGIGPGGYRRTVVPD
ncbi:hypothetical protein [Massilia putida]|uniref:hypothetical protein n=1 Tax=Massilia putida TaxID=1141883 RepID=UPI001E349694|nr:hypothetical protein [Massilia putida]